MAGRLGVAITFCAALFATSCGERDLNSSGRFGSDLPLDERFSGFGSSVRGDPDRVPGSLQRGSDQYVNSNLLRNQDRAIVVQSSGNLVEISLVNASIEAAANAVLGETLGLNYVIQQGLSGTVTMQTTAPVPEQALLDLFQAALNANRLSMVEENGVIQIVQGSSGSQGFRLASSGVGQGNAIIVAPLEHISTSEMIDLLEPLIQEGLQVFADQPRNLLLLSGSQSVLETALEALNLFDTSVMEGRSIAIVQVTAASPEAIVFELEAIFSSGEGGALAGVVEFVPNDRLGSVLIISSRSEYMDQARRWIVELDQAATGIAPYLHTYRLQSRDAEEIAPILDGLLQSASPATGEGGDASGAADIGPRVAADQARNSLIVRATREEHREIEAIIQQLDTPARQVLIEATIAEVALNEEVGVSVRWFFERGNWQTRLSDLSDGAVAGTSPGFSAVFGVGDANVALSALSSVTDVRVISTPTLMVVDNGQGQLQIGDQVPVATQFSNGTGSDSQTVQTQVEYRDTGIILTVAPRVSSSGQVSLDIVQEVSDVSATRTSGIDSPTISQRRVETSVVLLDGQTLALGGLVQESDNAGRSGVPGVSEVPVVGALFGERGSARERTELLILIRPQVVHDPTSAREVTEGWRERLSGANGILETGLGEPRHELGDILN